MAVRILQEEEGGHVQQPLLTRALAVEVALLGQGGVFWKGKVIGIISLCCWTHSTNFWQRPRLSTVSWPKSDSESESSIVPFLLFSSLFFHT